LAHGIRHLLVAVITAMKITLPFVVLVGLLAALACRKPGASTPAASDRPQSELPAAPPQSPPPAPANAAIDPSTTMKTGTSPALAKLTLNERRWGISPTLNDKVTYQPGVIIMEHGSDAVKGMATNGITWTIDARAPHANEIAVDRILFATDRVVGRVLKVDRTGDDLEVVLGPVELTDVIKECDLSAQQPIDLASMLVYEAPDLPGATTHDTANVQTTFATPRTPVLFASYDQTQPFQNNPVFDQLKSILIDQFLFVPVCCRNIGITMGHTDESVDMLATAAVELSPKPWVEFHLVIHGASIYTASVELHGVTGFRVVLRASASPGSVRNVDKPFFLPVDWRFPITGMAVPVSVVFRQTLKVTTMFTTSTSTIEAEGEYAFDGSFFAGKKNGGSWTATGPDNVTVVKNLGSTLTGASVGVNGLVFAYGAKVIVGIGAYGFVTGPFVGYNTTVSLEKGSQMTVAALPPCRGVTYFNELKYGVGYQTPKPFVDGLNFFLHLINIKPVTGEGGLAWQKTLRDTKAYYPAGCDPTAAT
jgi:hypothetical protein